MRSRLCMSKHFGYRGWGGGKRTRSQQYSWLEFHIYAQGVCVCVLLCNVVECSSLIYNPNTWCVCECASQQNVPCALPRFFSNRHPIKTGVRRIGGTSTTRKCGLGTCNVRSSSWHSITPESIYVYSKVFVRARFVCYIIYSLHYLLIMSNNDVVCG